MLSCEEKEAGDRVKHGFIMYNEPIVGNIIVNGREERILN